MDEHVMIQIGPVAVALTPADAQEFVMGILGIVASIRGDECFLLKMGKAEPVRIDPAKCASPEPPTKPVNDRPRPKPKTRWHR